jgi:hypothetical protein
MLILSSTTQLKHAYGASSCVGCDILIKGQSCVPRLISIFVILIPNNKFGKLLFDDCGCDTYICALNE